MQLPAAIEIEFQQDGFQRSPDHRQAGVAGIIKLAVKWIAIPLHAKLATERTENSQFKIQKTRGFNRRMVRVKEHAGVGSCYSWQWVGRKIRRQVGEYMRHLGRKK